MSFFPHPVGLLAGGLTALSFVTSAIVDQAVITGAGTDTITAPSGIQAGDLIVLYDERQQTAGTVTAAAPSGFTAAVTTNVAATVTAIISYKIAAGTESGTSITGISGTATSVVNMIMAVFRGNLPVTSVTAASANQQETDTTPTNQTITSGSGTAPLIALASYHNNSSGSAISPRGFSPAADGEITANTHNFLDYKIYNSSPANITVSMADFGTVNTLQSCYLACA